MKKAQERRWKKRHQVDLVICPNYGRHAHFLVNGEPMREAMSKEHLFGQMINLVRRGDLSFTRAKELATVILAAPRICNTDAEFEAIAFRDVVLLAALDDLGAISALLVPAR